VTFSSPRNGATAATRKDVAFARVAALAPLRGLAATGSGSLAAGQRYGGPNVIVKSTLEPSAGLQANPPV
jgi:hypothetical protein